MKLYKYMALIIFVCCACKGGHTTKNTQAVSEDKQTNAPAAFTLPEIPTMYTTPEQRADFLVKHYWDNFDFTDTAYIHLPQITEQAYVDFLDVIKHSPTESGHEGIRRLMVNAEKNKKVFNYFVSLADKYLYDPNSPFLNEEAYITVLESMLKSTLLEDTEKERPKYRLQLAQKNRVGTKALNFTYTLKSGKQGTLYGLSADFLLVYINNPGCHACREITEGLKASGITQDLLAQKRMTILCIYPDEDLGEWEKHWHDFPASWINSYDKGSVIENKELYDLKAIPSLYLLDKNKTVLLKDATLPNVEQYLSLHS